MGVREEAGTIAALDGVRGVAVLWVMLFHYRALADPAHDGWARALQALPAADRLVAHGYLGVDLFFLLSGFLLALPWWLRALRGEPAPAAREFWRRRIRRIVPAYYAHLVLLFALFAPLLLGWDYWRRDLWVVLWNGVAHGAFLHTTSPLTAGSLNVNGALWTLAVEAQFYLLLPLAAPLAVRFPRAALAAGFAAAAAWIAGAQYGFDALVAAARALGAHWAWPEADVRRLLLMQLPAYLGHFALGMALAQAWLARREVAGPQPAIAGLAAMALLALAIAMPAPPFGPVTPLATTAALGVLLWAAAAGRGPLARRVLGAGPLACAGRVSYSAYLYHLPLLLLVKAAGWPAALALPAWIAATFATAWLSWRFIETRFWRASPPTAPRGSPAPAAPPLPTAPG